MAVRVTQGKALVGVSPRRTTATPNPTEAPSSPSPTSRTAPARARSIGRAHELERYELLEQKLSDAIYEGPLVAVVVPVLARPHRVRPLFESFWNATSRSDANLYFVAQRSDAAEVAAIRAVGAEIILVDDCDRSWARKINRGYEATSEPWLLLGADDLSFHPGWIDTVRDLLVSYAGVVGTNDLGNASTIRGDSSTHPLVRRLYADVFGTADERGKITHEGYDHNFPDSELVETAKVRELFTHRRNCVIEHLHPMWGKAEHDRVYKLGAARWKIDESLFKTRRAKFGF